MIVVVTVQTFAVVIQTATGVFEWADRTLITADFIHLVHDLSPLAAGAAAHLGLRHLAKQKAITAAVADRDEVRDDAVS